MNTFQQFQTLFSIHVEALRNDSETGQMTTNYDVLNEKDTTHLDDANMFVHLFGAGQTL